MNAWVTLTNRCNNRCLFCYELDAKGARAPAWDASAPNVRMQIRAARSSGASGVVLTGGEPTLSESLAPAIAEARALGMNEVLLASNGRRLAYKPYAQALVRAGLTHAHLSLHSHDPKVHDGLSRAPGAFEQTAAGIQNLLAEGVQVTCSIVVNRRNARDLAAYFNRLRELGVRRASVMGLKPFGGAFKHWRELAFDPAAHAASLSSALAYGVACGLALKTMGLSREHVDVRGTESDDRRALQYFEETTAAMGEVPYCAGLCDACFGRAVCAYGGRGLSLGPLVCKCSQVHAETLRAAVRQGARTVEQLSSRTGACRGCCSCRPRLEALLGDAPRFENGGADSSALPAPRAPAPPGAFAAAIDVPPACRGEAETPGCLFSRGHFIYPELRCGQRCLLGDAARGSPKWIRAVLQLSMRLRAPVYVYGADGQLALDLAREAALASARFRGDLCGSILSLHGSAQLGERARSDARAAQRAGLRFSIETDDAAVDALYSLYLAQCEHHQVRPLPREFITSERDRNPEAFAVALVRSPDSTPLSGRLVLVRGNYLRLVDGGWRREHRGAHAEALLSVSLLEWGAARGVEVFDGGIAEADNRGLRLFRRRLGYREIGAVCSVEVEPATVPAPPASVRMSRGRIDLALGKLCNHDCLFCYRGEAIQELTTLEAKQRIEAAAASRFSGISLSGGEPTLRADLEELIAHASAHGIADIQLHTNGARIADPAYLSRLVGAGLSSAMVSVHSHRPEVYRAITGRPNFEKARQAIKNLLGLGRQTLISHVVCALNFADLPSFPDYVASEFPGAELFFFFVYPGERAAKHPEVVPRLPDVEPSWRRALTRIAELGLRATVDCLAGFPPCYMRGFEPMAKLLWMNSLRDEIGDEADDHLAMLKQMRKPPGCEQCAYTHHCYGFWSSYLDRFGDDDLRPVPGAPWKPPRS